MRVDPHVNLTIYRIVRKILSFVKNTSWASWCDLVNITFGHENSRHGQHLLFYNYYFYDNYYSKVQ